MTATTATAESGFVDLDGVRTYHEITGSGDPLVLLHGGMCTIDTFGDLAAVVATRHRVHRPERRGHGRTADVPGPITYENMAADTVAYLERLELAPAHLVGWSDGAVVALLVALTRPDLVRSLVVIGTALTEDGLPAEMRPLPERLPVDVLPPFLREMYAAVSPDGPEHFDVVFDKLSPSWTALPYVDLSELPRIATPTLVMAGDRDMVTPEHAAAVAQAIPQGRLAIVPGDHAVPLEKPGLVGDIVLDFIAGI